MKRKHMSNIPHGYDEIVATYGNPHGTGESVNENWYNSHIVAFTPPYAFSYQEDNGSLSPITHMMVHALIISDLHTALTSVYNAARQLVKQNDGDGHSTMYYDKRTIEVLTEHRCNVFSGSFNYRSKRGQDVPSVHSFGVAIDFDAEHNAFGSQQGTLPSWFIKAFTDLGWEWGGQWQASNKDWMHFQRATGY